MLFGTAAVPWSAYSMANGDRLDVYLSSVDEMTKKHRVDAGVAR